MKRRQTLSKKKILQLFQESNSALSSIMIESKLKGDMDRSTVYRILTNFEKDGVLHKIVDPEGKIYYALCKQCESDQHRHDHFHFKCIKCEKIECFEQELPTPSKKGYIFNDIFGLVNGICPSCN